MIYTDDPVAMLEVVLKFVAAAVGVAAVGILFLWQPCGPKCKHDHKRPEPPSNGKRETLPVRDYNPHDWFGGKGL